MTLYETIMASARLATLARDPDVVRAAWHRHIERHGAGLVNMEVSEEMPDGSRQIRRTVPVAATPENMKAVWADAQMFADTGIPACVIHARFVHANLEDSVIDRHFIQAKPQ